MMQRMEPFDRMRPVETVNTWREKVVTWISEGTVKAAISDGGGKLQEINMLYRIESTHTAVTWDTVQTGERLRTPGGTEFRVEYVIPGGRWRMSQLYLKRIEAEPEGVTTDANQG